MARLIGTIRVDLAGIEPMWRCLASLREALSIAQYDRPLDLESCPDGLRFGAALIARIEFGPLIDWVIRARAVPTFRMSLFVVEITTRVPGLRVTWDDGWPRFSAHDDDADDPADPGPVVPEGMPIPT